jgi:adenine-specific DNA-methyltransferase
VNNQSPIRYFYTQPSAQPAYEGAVDIVEDAGADYGFMSIRGSLQDGNSAIVIWRTISDDVILSNAALDAFFTSQCKDWDMRNVDVVYVNGDSNLELLKKPGEHWKVVRIDKEFNQLMFD